jgi:6-phosphogluconolactonase (cycloisomerase 2 family)
VRTIITAFICVFLLLVVCTPLASQTSGPIYLFSLENKAVSTGTVHVYNVNSSSGALTEVPGSPFTAGLSPDEIAVDPSGKFFYVINQQSDDIAAFSVDASSGTLTPLPGSPFPVGTQPAGQQPIALAIDPTGRFLYVAATTDIGTEVSYNFYEFTIDSATGVLTAAPSSPLL